MPEVRAGIVWQDDEESLTAECARCGGCVEWLDCASCNAEGTDPGDEGWEDVPDDSAELACPVCGGATGAWHCINTPEFCAANPLPGREGVESTALRSEVWNDV